MPPDPQADPPPGQDEADRIQTLDARFGAIETEQKTQRGLLEQIAAAVGGTGPAAAAHDKAEARTQDRLANPPAATIADQVRQAVKDVQAEQDQAARDQAHQADHDKLRQASEQPPREPQSGPRARLQRILYGGDR
jgi:hypothetical protein